METTNTTSAPAIPTPTPAAVPIPLPPGSCRQELTPSEAEIFAGWIKEDVAKGKVTPEQAATSFNQLSTPAERRTPDSRTEEEIELDALSPPAKPTDYRIVYDHVPIGQPIPPEVRQFDESARMWMSESGLSRELGNSLVTIVDRVSKDTAQMSEAEREQYGYQQYDILQKTFGSELEKKLQRAGQMVQELEQKRPGLNALLKSSIGDSAKVASMLIHHADLYYARKKGGSHAG